MGGAGVGDVPVARFDDALVDMVEDVVEAEETISVKLDPGPMFIQLVKPRRGTGAKLKGFRPKNQGGSPVERAGVSVGWRLSSVDGRDVRRMTFHEIMLLLKSKAKKKRTLAFYKRPSSRTNPVAGADHSAVRSHRQDSIRAFNRERERDRRLRAKMEAEEDI